MDAAYELRKILPSPPPCTKGPFLTVSPCIVVVGATSIAS
jgi:hypothetical protein